jgi:uncharacterized protein (DUF1697 family)
MPRYVAFLRGVSPMNAKMPALKRCFEKAGFTDVRTLLSSGNVVFDSRPATQEALERRAEAAMERSLGRAFATTVRTVKHLQLLLDSDPFAGFELPGDAKCVVTFLRRPVETSLVLPIERDGARILDVRGCEVFSAYVRSESGPVFMQLLERTFGKEITTRTWGTVGKCAGG